MHPHMGIYYYSSIKKMLQKGCISAATQAGVLRPLAIVKDGKFY